MAMFDDLKNGLSEVDAFLSGKRVGYKVAVPAVIDVKTIGGGVRISALQAKSKRKDDQAPA